MRRLNFALRTKGARCGNSVIEISTRTQYRVL